MMKYVLVLLCVVAFATVVLAQPPAAAPNYNALIGASDLIVLGGVETAEIPAVPAAPAGGGGFGGGAANTGTATITFKVEKALLGTTDAGTITLTVPLTLTGGRGGGGGGGAAAPRTWTPNVAVGTKLVIGLVKTQAGLTVTPAAGGGGMGGGAFGGGGAASVIDAAQATAVVDAIAKFPVKVTVTAPTDPLVIGGKASFTVTVKNTGTTVLTLASVRLLAVSDNAKLTNGATFTAVADDIRDAAGAARTIAAGAEATISAIVTVVGPANWQMFHPKVFPLASQVSASVTTTTPAAAGGGGGGGGGFARVTMITAKSAGVAATIAVPKP